MFNQPPAPIMPDFVERPAAVVGKVYGAIASNTRQYELLLETAGQAN